MKKIFIALVILLFIIYFTVEHQNHFAEPPLLEAKIQIQEQSAQHAEDELPKDKLFITVERQEYADGDLKLIIPSLNISESVQNGTTDEALKKGVGLYEYAQLPGEGDRNVSIAGHRDLYGNIFYYIDHLDEDDYLYLTDNKNIWCYQYLDTKVVEEDDWSPIYSQGFSCITLTTCEPIGVSDHRLIVRGKLISIDEYSDSYNLK